MVAPFGRAKREGFQTWGSFSRTGLYVTGKDQNELVGPATYLCHSNVKPTGILQDVKADKDHLPSDIRPSSSHWSSIKPFTGINESYRRFDFKNWFKLKRKEVRSAMKSNELC